MVYRGSDPLGSGQLTLGWKTVSFSPVLQHEVLIQQVGNDSLPLIVRLMIRKTTTWKTGRNWRWHLRSNLEITDFRFFSFEISFLQTSDEPHCRQTSQT